MATWTSTTHTIADIKEWADEGKLIIQPAYQRNTVWNQAARIMLIDSILNDIPIPKIFIAKTLNDNKAIRRVIDGQQRINAILDFLNDDLKLQKPYKGDFENFTFSELPQNVKDAITLEYNIDINEITNPTDKQEREVYSRVNKYTIPLNAQELRQAEFPGEFLELAREIAAFEFWDDYRFFTPGAIRRNLDVEFISETLILLISGIQDKKSMLDDYYFKYMKMGKLKEQIKSIYIEIINEIKIIIDGILSYDGDLLFDEKSGKKSQIKKSRFTQQADFYSLMSALQDLIKIGGTLKNKNIQHLIEDFVLLELNIAPESKINLLKDYAVKCISQANSASSRKWRANLLKGIINGTMKISSIEEEFIKTLYSLKEDFIYNISIECPCPIEQNSLEEELSIKDAHYVGWRKDNYCYQLSNIELFSQQPNSKDYIYCKIG